MTMTESATVADTVLATEYSPEFDRLRQNRMIMSYYKYGPVRENYGWRLLDAVAAMQRCLDEYRNTGNTEVLCDLANFAMIEFMCPQHPGAHFDTHGTEGVDHAVGMSINQISQFGEPRIR